MKHFDIAIIGGGHAGLEAAWISSQFGLNVGVITMPEVPIASTPCNPAVGGVGKGQVVRELDALGGVMGRVADMSAIQYRILNESKGFAVQSTRVQVDKFLYEDNAKSLVENNKFLSVVREKVEKVSKDGEVFVIETSNNTFTSDKLVVTTGTFLAGKLHTGAEQSLGGRVDASSSAGLKELFSMVEVLPTRFKTGTPPRIDKNTINFSEMVEQKSDKRTRNFHSLHTSDKRFCTQVSCYITHTNDDTLGIIRENKEKSPIYNGQIKGVGPRYCPSIEDKAFRYVDRNTHHVFIEPEGLNTDSIYPNGVSTSLPREVQQNFINTIQGLESAKILVHGHAVEYDVVDTTKLNQTLEYQDIKGLYFAGQVNGTSGYEEAAGQGLMAGVNAALSFLEREPLILSRNDSYIGVMIEDLVTCKRDEPYRLFTARSENRLYVREDNTINRMAAYRQKLGLYSELDRLQEQYLKEFKLLLQLCSSTTYIVNEFNKERFIHQNYGELSANISLSELLKRSKLDPIETLEIELKHFGCSFLEDVVRSVAISTKYEGYIQRSNVEFERVNRFAHKKINWKKLIDAKNVSYECKQRIEEVRPSTFRQLQMIEGIRPATLAFVAGNLV